jgi:hypothetical protein
MEDQNARITPAGIGALIKGDLENFRVASMPRVIIETQEAVGQIDMIKTTQLPIAVEKLNFERDNPNIIKESKEIWGKLGIEIIDKVDELFFSVKLPDKWEMKTRESSYGTYLVDEKGRERVSIFYKAAFYDRRAYADITRRFRISTKHEFELDWSKACNLSKNEFDKLRRKEEESLTFGIVLDGENVIFETKHEKKFSEKSWKQVEKFNKICRKYLDKNYPDWENPFAYWE